MRSLTRIASQQQTTAAKDGLVTFDGHGISAGVVCLTICGAVGTTLLAVVAARGKRAADTTTDRSEATIAQAV